MDRFAATELDVNGDTKLRFNGDKMVHFEDDQTYEFARPAMRSYDPGRPPVSGRADRGKMNADGSIIDLYDNGLIAGAGSRPGAGPADERGLRVLPDPRQRRSREDRQAGVAAHPRRLRDERQRPALQQRHARSTIVRQRARHYRHHPRGARAEVLSHATARGNPQPPLSPSAHHHDACLEDVVPRPDFAALLAAAAALCLAPAAHAERADRDKPLVLEADNASYDDVKQVYTLTGNVLTKGTMWC